MARTASLAYKEFTVDLWLTDINDVEIGFFASRVTGPSRVSTARTPMSSARWTSMASAPGS